LTLIIIINWNWFISNLWIIKLYYFLYFWPHP